MTKQFILTLYLVNIVLLNASDGFYLKGRSGILVKTDIKSGLKKNYPIKKGPGEDEVPKILTSEDFDSLVNTITHENDKKAFENCYEKVDDSYLLISNDVSTKIARGILLKYNNNNEIPSGIDDHGTPMPHRFPRVFNPKTKVNIDFCFAWGYRFKENVSLDFSFNLTNFIMPSLELGVNYHFDLGDSYNFEPFIGTLIYGGFIDGFPIGFSLAGGLDFFPVIKDDKMTKNFFIGPELRIGTVWFTDIYYDTGVNSEGIWKNFNLLGEAGFYVNSGYRWDQLK
ncbi:MAG: hypothetical protein A2015_00720 [Spirochaetes bacterium GWF1_31_7]|nr:MAG: hypothetical protein A2Y30_12585 [Spirochaetes bacterium GWE1_32_154]OHD51646.1 MAG: hypothetical protein A2Y29_04385 [Spirochaetes bacterium GWE2_31_10]OHD51899.1 MAG: hypothetical protein A2015_00720 [Spirochaetes bacterium GWF1_31_7]OHD81009.1 MAG: hypothetical protein A2355_08660 [Spirochaetes bacterium RIFOXYB1_FULL_32_8]HBD93775.1 hypothetical protein [Spirochaetia bacterium]